MPDLTPDERTILTLARELARCIDSDDEDANNESSAEDAIVELRAALRTTQNQANRFAEDIADLRANLDASMTEAKALLERASTAELRLSDEVANHNATACRLRGGLADLNAKLTQAERDRDKAREDAESWKVGCEAAESRLADLTRPAPVSDEDLHEEWYRVFDADLGHSGYDIALRAVADLAVQRDRASRPAVDKPALVPLTETLLIEADKRLRDDREWLRDSHSDAAADARALLKHIEAVAHGAVGIKPLVPLTEAMLAGALSDDGEGLNPMAPISARGLMARLGPAGIPGPSSPGVSVVGMLTIPGPDRADDLFNAFWSEWGGSGEEMPRGEVRQGKAAMRRALAALAPAKVGLPLEPTRAPIKIGADGRCDCSAGHRCPLGRVGSQLRCRADELRAAGVEIVSLWAKVEPTALRECPDWAAPSVRATPSSVPLDKPRRFIAVPRAEVNGWPANVQYSEDAARNYADRCNRIPGDFMSDADRPDLLIGYPWAVVDTQAVRS